MTSPSGPASLRELPGRYFRRAAWPTVVAVGGLAAYSQVTSGAAQAVAVLIGGAMVIGFFGVDLLAMRVSARWDPAATFLLVMVEYLVKIVLLAIALVAIGQQDAVEGRWVGISIGVAATVFLAALVVAYLRVPTFVVDPQDSGPPAAGGTSTPADET